MPPGNSPLVARGPIADGSEIEAVQHSGTAATPRLGSRAYIIGDSEFGDQWQMIRGVPSQL